MSDQITTLEELGAVAGVEVAAEELAPREPVRDEPGPRIRDR